MTAIVPLLDERIDAKHLLKHPFYQSWSNGMLSLYDLRFYSQQYFAHVKAFPTYLSEMHSRCENLDHRKIIARNLADEEAGTPTHPELWLAFAEGIGASRESVSTANIGPRMRALTTTYKALAQMETGMAAAALYCYEKQIPAVAEAKILGLKTHYEIAKPETLEYFRVHQEADVEHAAEWITILEREALTPVKATFAADMALNALWAALDEIDETRSTRTNSLSQCKN